MNTETKKTMRKILTFLLCAALMLTTSVTCAFAEDDPVSGDAGGGVTWSYDTAAKTLTFTKTGDGSGVTDNTHPWYMYNNEITTVRFEEGVTGIGTFCFEDNSALTTVVIPATVNQFFNGTFRNESNLKTVVFLGYSTDFSFNYAAFYGLTALERAVFFGPEINIYNTNDDIQNKKVFAGDPGKKKRFFHTGEEIELIDWTAPETDPGFTVSWAAVPAGEDAPASFATAVPTAKDAGSYDVYVRLTTETETILPATKFRTVKIVDTLSGQSGPVQTYAYDPSSRVLTFSGGGYAWDYYSFEDNEFPWKDAPYEAVVIRSDVESVAYNAIDSNTKLVVCQAKEEDVQWSYGYYLPSDAMLYTGDLLKTNPAKTGSALTLLNTEVIPDNAGPSGSVKLLWAAVPAGSDAPTAFSTDASAVTDEGTYDIYMKAVSRTDETHTILPAMKIGSVTVIPPVTGTCGNGVTWSFDVETGFLTIDGTGDMDDYDGKDVSWAFFKNMVKGVVIGSGITSVGEDAFAGHGNLNLAVVYNGHSVPGNGNLPSGKTIYMDDILKSDMAYNGFSQSLVNKPSLSGGTVYFGTDGYSVYYDDLAEIGPDTYDVYICVYDASYHEIVPVTRLGSVTIKPYVIDAFDLSPLIVSPVNGGTPQKAVASHPQYTASIAWEGNPQKFAAGTSYTATVTLTPAAGFTLTGVAENAFTYPGAAATSEADSGTVRIVFPKTGEAAVSGIDVKTSPNKTVYRVGDPLDVSGLVLTASFEDGTKKDVYATPDMVSGFDSAAEAESLVLTVSFGGKTVTYTVSVEKAPAIPKPSPAKPEKKGCAGTGTRNIVFTDVAEEDWFKEATDYVAEHGMMEGVSEFMLLNAKDNVFEAEFNPSGTTTRGTLATILARLDGVTILSGGEKWYKDGMDWAVRCGVSDGLFPEENITREQVAVMLFRFSLWKKCNVFLTSTLAGYNDVSDISDYALDAMRWAVGSGVIEGDNGMLYPVNTITRAELATMLMRFSETFVK